MVVLAKTTDPKMAPIAIMLRRVRREVRSASFTSGVKIVLLFSRNFIGDYFCALVKSFHKGEAETHVCAGYGRKPAAVTWRRAAQTRPVRSSREQPGQASGDDPRQAACRNDRLTSEGDIHGLATSVWFGSKPFQLIEL